jgi:hypothetical protein
VSVEERVVVAGRSPNRCPFCHEACEADDATVCQDCLARHHADCWSESARCAACGSARSLAPTSGAKAGPSTTVRPAARDVGDVRANGLTLVIATVGAGAAHELLAAALEEAPLAGGHPAEVVSFGLPFVVAVLVPGIAAALIRALGRRRHVAIGLSILLVVGLFTLLDRLRGLSRDSLVPLCTLWIVASIASSALSAVGVEWLARARRAPAGRGP